MSLLSSRLVDGSSHRSREHDKGRRPGQLRGDERGGGPRGSGPVAHVGGAQAEVDLPPVVHRLVAGLVRDRFARLAELLPLGLDLKQFLELLQEVD